MRLVFGVLALAPLAAFAQSLTPSQDAYYVPGSGTNYGTASTITVGSSSSVGLVQFDLSSLPAGVTANQVQKATLTLFLDHVGASGAINVYTVSAARLWSELTVNGNSRRRTGGEDGCSGRRGEHVSHGGCHRGRAELDYRPGFQ